MKRLLKKSESNVPTGSESAGAVILRSLSEKELLRETNRLRFFAVKRYYGTLNPEDLVNETVLSILSGSRSWRSDWTIYQNLRWNLRSIASNELQKDSRLIPLEAAIDDIEQLHANGELTESAVASDLLEARDDERLTKAMLYLGRKGDQFLMRIVEILLITGQWRPREIAAILAVDPKVVYPQKRRLMRRFAMLRTLK